MNGIELPPKGGWSRRRVVFVGFALAFLLSAAFFGLGFGPDGAGKFFGQTLTLVSDTIRDVLGLRSQSRLAAEIDLNRAPTDLQIGRQPGAASTAPPSVERIGAAAGPAKISKSLPHGKNSAEGEKTGNRGGDSSANRTTSEKQLAAAGASASAKTSAIAPPPADCNFLNGANPTHAVLLNEIAWMGSLAKNGETAAQASNNEWLELKNVSAQSAELSGWQILNQAGKFKVVFDAGEKIGAGKFYLLERTDDNTVPGVKADKIYSGALSNSGDWLRLFDRSCGLVDEINASAGSTSLIAGGWPGGNNDTKQTLERNVGDFGWHTSVAAGGTPKAENSVSAPAVSVQSQTSTNPDLRYLVAVAIQGDGSGSVTSSPSGISCGLDCGEEYPQGTSLTLSATPAADSVFDGWSGACSGKGTCSLTVTSTLSLAATFKLSAPLASSPLAFTTTTAGVNHLVIAEVQITGASTTNDFIKIFNPTGAAVDASGWKLRKRTQTQSGDNYYSLRVFPSGSSIAAQGYFVWANSAGGFSEFIGANTSSTQTLAADNSTALLDANDAIVDALAWGSGHTNPYVEGSAYPTNPDVNQVLKRKFTNGAVQDTNNNAADFELR